jgi:hypothetical protein
MGDFLAAKKSGAGVTHSTKMDTITIALPLCFRNVSKILSTLGQKLASTRLEIRLFGAPMKQMMNKRNRPCRQTSGKFLPQPDKLSANFNAINPFIH